MEEKLIPLYDLPRYSRVKTEELGEFNFLFVDGMYANCLYDNGKAFFMRPTEEAELICSMKEHDLKQL
jgi:hypothetical protein